MSDTNDKTPIKYVLIGDPGTNKIITEFSASGVNSNVKKEINRIFSKLTKIPNRNYDERNKITAKEENYYFIYKKPNFLFVVLAISEYPERYVFELIDKIVEDNIPSMINDETKELNPTGRQALKDLVNKYQDIKNISKIAEIQEDVNSLKVDMKKNIAKMVESVENVNELQNKSEQLKLETQDYKNNSVTLRKLTWWQNAKLWIIIIGVVLILVLIIVLATCL